MIFNNLYYIKIYKYKNNLKLIIIKMINNFFI